MKDWINPQEAAAAMAHGDGAGVRVAILDSGVEINHPDFGGRRLQDDVVVELEETLPGDGVDIYGHGTALASIIWGLAPKAQIGSFRVLGPNLRSRSALVTRAAESAISLGYHILHCSFACGIPGHLPLYKSWADRATLSGVHVVAASGSHDLAAPEWPAHLGTVLGVDAAASGEGAPAFRTGTLVAFTAPGSECHVAWNHGQRRVMTGSSFAAAHFSGLLARLLSVHGSQDPFFLQALLRQVLSKEEGDLQRGSAGF